jgi:hypothetical protein
MGSEEITKGTQMSKHPELLQHYTTLQNIFGESVYFESYFEVEEAERGSREDGMQMEPDYPTEVTLCYCYIKGEEMLEFLSESVVEKLEVKALGCYFDQTGEE